MKLTLEDMKKAESMLDEDETGECVCPKCGHEFVPGEDEDDSDYDEEE